MKPQLCLAHPFVAFLGVTKYRE